MDLVRPLRPTQREHKRVSCQRQRLENIGINLDPALEPVLGQQKVKDMPPMCMIPVLLITISHKIEFERERARERARGSCGKLYRLASVEGIEPAPKGKATRCHLHDLPGDSGGE